MNRFRTILATIGAATVLLASGTARPARGAAPQNPFVDCFCLGAAGAAPHSVAATAGDIALPPWPPPWPWPCPPWCDPAAGDCSGPALDAPPFVCQLGGGSEQVSEGGSEGASEDGLQNRAIAENVDSPGSSAYASQSQYAPVRQDPQEP
jgi:hypothetical protein